MDPRTPAPTTTSRGPGAPAVAIALAALLVGGVVGGVVATAAGGDNGSPAPEAGSVEAIAAELAEGQAAASAELNDELAEVAETAHGSVEGVLAGLAQVAPPEGAVPVDADVEADPAALAAEVEQARERLTATGQGADDHGVTRAALIGALDLLAVAVEAASELPPGGTEPDQDVLARVARDRDAAVDLWQAGATRLDTLVVVGGGEHIHLFVAPDGNPESLPQEFQELHED
ncbi:hypothetical protein [Aquipuribacter sp. MA13-6]|uniref:hypothetical protein n=1 Tax=unclassified Aquipuribacter TaxID=2635084 RepID=UPI003EEDDB50